MTAGGNRPDKGGGKAKRLDDLGIGVNDLGDLGAGFMLDGGRDGVDVVGDYAPLDPGLPDDVPVGLFEDEAEAEKERVLGQMAQARKDSMARRHAATNYDFFFCVVFADQTQRDAFLKASGWDSHGVRYVNGVALAKEMGIELPPTNYKPPAKGERGDPQWSRLALDLHDEGGG